MGVDDRAQVWLQLLDDEEPAARFEAYRKQLATQLPARARAAMEADAARANRIRTHLEDRKRHADELVVLNDIARRLATMRESAEVLQEVTAQSRRLLAVDVAYIMLMQDSGVLRIEYTDGSMGSVMRGIELAVGRGLGGQVVATGQPVWSRSYLDDHRFPHEETLDSAAASEQLGGILGVPMLLGHVAIGVLLAADRRPRSFGGREVALLAAMSSHAAVAINNARLFEQTRAALDDLRRVNVSLEHDNAVRQRISDLRERLTAAIARGEGVSMILAEMTASTGSPVSIYDAGNERLVGAHTDRLEDLVGHVQAAEVVEGCDPSSVVRVDGIDGSTVILAPARLPSGYAGCLAVSEAPDDQDMRRLMPIGAATLAIVVSSERMLAEAALRTRSEFVNALLSPDVDRESIKRRARSVGIDLDRIFTVAVFDSGGVEPRDAGRRAAALASWFSGWSVEHRDHIVVLLPRASVDEATDRLHRLQRGDLPCAVGVAPCNGGTDAVRESYELARQTANVLRALGRVSESAQPSELGVFRTLFSDVGRDEVTSFIERTVGPVIAYDASRRRDLGLTLLTYLRQAQHHTRTCEVLHIHANTLYQRLDRVTELLGDDWRDPDRSLEIHLALRLSAVLASLPGQRR